CDNGRLAALEKKVGEEARLRAMMDKDLAELNLKVDANTSLLQALATTQGEHTRMLTRLEDRATRVEYRVDQVDQKVDSLQQEMRAGFQVIVAKLDQALGN
ncbi:MAG TPA: hypothetical protein VFB06_01010, partial [Streptosporangiaceae bacterium]|nr:hypothetical protein [Streptosporangiaceae bacterium]